MPQLYQIPCKPYVSALIKHSHSRILSCHLSDRLLVAALTLDCCTMLTGWHRYFMAITHAQTGTMQHAWALMLQRAPTRPGSRNRYPLTPCFSSAFRCYPGDCMCKIYCFSILQQMLPRKTPFPSMHLQCPHLKCCSLRVSCLLRATKLLKCIVGQQHSRAATMEL